MQANLDLTEGLEFIEPSNRGGWIMHIFFCGAAMDQGLFLAIKMNLFSVNRKLHSLDCKMSLALCSSWTWKYVIICWTTFKFISITCGLSNHLKAVIHIAKWFHISHILFSEHKFTLDYYIQNAFLLSNQWISEVHWNIDIGDFKTHPCQGEKIWKQMLLFVVILYLLPPCL